MPNPTDVIAHTPGPWSAFYKHKYKEWHVAIPMAGSSMKLALWSDGCPTANPAADAKLIAAAPAMYASLKEIAVGEGYYGAQAREYKEIARAALASIRAVGDDEAREGMVKLPVEVDLTKCPGCGGPADNGHDRCVPSSPYYCSKCDAMIAAGAEVEG